MDFEMLLKIIEQGSTPVIGLIAYFLWKLDRSITIFFTELRAQQESRDKKLDDIHDDLSGVIRKLAGVNGRE